MSQKHPTSPLKSQPQPKRPNSAQGNPIVTRGATALNIDSTIRNFDTFFLKPIEKFDPKKLPTNADILQRIFYVKDQKFKFLFVF